MKMMSTGLAAVALALTAVPATATELKPLDADHFSLMMPGSPERRSNEVAVREGTIATQSWTISDDESVLYSISTADFPQKMIDKSTPTKFLDDARNGLRDQLKGTVKDDQEISLAGNPGREFMVVSDNGELKARAYFVEGRLYTLLVLYNPSIGAPQRDAFLGSLKLKKAAR